MLCPECGSEVGDKLKICERCARKRIQLSDYAKMSGVMETHAGLSSSAEMRAAQANQDTGAALKTVLLATGVLTFLCAMGLAYFMFGGPSRATLDSSRNMFSALFCQTNLLTQVEDYLALQDATPDEALKAKGKLSLAIVDSMLGKNGISTKDYDRVRGLWSSRREKFELSVFDSVKQTCGFKAEDQGRVVRVLEWLLTTNSESLS